jgi:outer membrane protein TolC
VGGAAVSVSAQEALTLDDCVKIALQTRRTIIASRGDEQLAAAGKKSALGDFLPTVSLLYDYSDDEVTDQERDVLDSAGNIMTQSLPDFDATSKFFRASASVNLINVPTWFNYAAARNSHQAAKLDVIASELDLIYRVKSTYFNYLAEVENVSVQEKAVSRSEEQLKLIQSKYDLGSASRSDLLKQRVQLGNDRISLLMAQNLVRTKQAGLAYVIGLDPRRDYSFSTEIVTESFEGTLQDAIDYGTESSPSVTAAERSLVASNNRVRSAWATYLPVVTGSASYSKSDAQELGEFTRKSTSKGFGFTATWTIFDGFFREEQVVRQKVFRNNARAGLADTRNNVVQEVKTAYLNVQLYKEQKTVSEENVASATEDLNITQEKYNLGAATILDLLESQVSLTRAQVQLIAADFNLKTSLADLERAMGKR